MDTDKLEQLAKLIRYYILTSTTEAGSGHPTTCLSAVELTTTLFFGGFYHYDLTNPDNPKNDRVIFSKGHAAPLLYALYCAVGAIKFEELLTLRKADSPLEGHPTPNFKYTEAATGSLGQGLSIGLGMALAGVPRVFVLLGDGEMAEGNVWEAIEVAGFYKVPNLIGILDVNRLGQSGETMVGWDVEVYQKRIEAFGWETQIIDGHSLSAINQAYQNAINTNSKPKMIIAKTVKGKGVAAWENQEGRHAKTLSKEELQKVIDVMGIPNLTLKGEITKP